MISIEQILGRGSSYEELVRLRFIWDRPYRVGSLTLVIQSIRVKRMNYAVTISQRFVIVALQPSTYPDVGCHS